MGTLMVVHMAPVIDGLLGAVQAGKGPSGQDFGLKAAVKAFFLAQGLRMRAWNG